MIKDLTTLKWKKNIYYVSDDVIFDIESKAKKFDIDCCGMYLVDINEKLKDGVITVLEPEAYIEKVPYIIVEFNTDGGRILKRYFPVQSLIEEGDKVIEGKVSQLHPDVFDNKYINKFNQDIFNSIKKLIKDPFNAKNLQIVKNALPDWLTINEGKPMTEDYIDKYFLKGQHYNDKLATKGEELFYFNNIKLGIGDELYHINIWSDNNINKIINALGVEFILNKFTGTTTSMEFAAEALRDIKEGNKSISTLLNINYVDDLAIVNLESLCAGKDIDTYYEYLKSKDTTRFFTLLDSEEIYNSLMNDENSGLSLYYKWSDQVNAPYKEDLWNTVAGRAANINDAKKDSETGEFLLDEAGNYIYENCERCWQGAIGAPGAKFPWMVVKYDGVEPSTITFKYTYPNGAVKTVNPWGDKVFGGNPEEPRRVWGVASLAAEFEDNDFLIGGTFDIKNFEMILNPVE